MSAARLLARPDRGDNRFDATLTGRSAKDFAASTACRGEGVMYAELR